MSKRCLEPLGASYRTGVVLCRLEAGHEGDHDGGASERILHDEFVAMELEKRAERL